MRMDPADIADVTGSTYTFLVNGYGPYDNWTGLFKAGERVRLRIINAAAQTNFNVRIPDLPMTVGAGGWARMCARSRLTSFRSGLPRRLT
jgi:FtsP/CotA-like multicopper oxidase with cupredoxin domain